MDHKNDTSAFDPVHRCLILGQKAKVRELRQVLGFTFSPIEVVEAVQEIDHLPGGSRPDLLIVTDSVAGGLSPILLTTAKSKLDPRAIICLANRLDSRTEIGLRAVGLVFLGSYETFWGQADVILKGLVGSRTGSPPGKNHPVFEPAEDRLHLARSIQERLHHSTRGYRWKAVWWTSRVAAVSAGLVMRAIELVMGLAVGLPVVLPVYLILLVRCLVAGTPVFSPRVIVGRGQPVTILRFNQAGPFQNLPMFLELIRGRLALVGTSIIDWESRPVTPTQGYIRQIKPGIMSLWRVRRASRIAHEGRENVEWEYVYKKGLVYDLLLVLSGIPGLVYGAGDQTPPPVFHLLDLDIANLSMVEAVGRLEEAVADNRSCRVFFVNPDCLNKMVVDRDYFQILSQADYVFPDGIGLTVAGKLLKTPLKENINGTDMLPYLCRMAASRNYALFLLGGRPGVAAEAARRLTESYQVTIAGTAHGYFDHDHESHQVIDQINRSGAHILLVGMGAPVQEKWITRYRPLLAPRVLMGVGGLFDFYSGNIKRAPIWMRETGLEWVYRILQEPGRMWRRYVIGNPLFLYRVAKWRFFAKRNKINRIAGD